jgi:hypothetical protein
MTFLELSQALESLEEQHEKVLKYSQRIKVNVLLVKHYKREVSLIKSKINKKYS